MKPMAQTFDDIIRAALAKRPETKYKIMFATGIRESVLSRFAAGKTSMSLKHASTLCEFLGLELRPIKKSRASKTRKAAKGGK